MTLNHEALKSEAFEKLLQTLAEIVRQARKGNGIDDIGLASLNAHVAVAIAGYGALQYVADEARKSTLHKLVPPLRRVIEALQSEANGNEINFALGRDGIFFVNPELGAARRKTLIADLEKLAAVRPRNASNAALYE